jgi:hypothetical protein
MWASYRLFTMHNTGQDSISLGYGRLQEQFGTGIAEANYRQFRKEFRLAFAKVELISKSIRFVNECLRDHCLMCTVTLHCRPLLTLCY